MHLTLRTINVVQQAMQSKHRLPKRKKHPSSKTTLDDSEIDVCDRLVRIGWAFLSMGMVMGSLWAKEAWGDYWTWDPKETWALLTWLSYLLYIHLRLFRRGSQRELCLLIIFSFACLQMCWWGVNYLPSAQDSVHVYNR